MADENPPAPLSMIFTRNGPDSIGMAAWPRLAKDTGFIGVMAEVELKASRGTSERVREAENPHSLVARFGADKPLKLDAGVELEHGGDALFGLGQVFLGDLEVGFERLALLFAVIVPKLRHPFNVVER